MGILEVKQNKKSLKSQPQTVQGFKNGDVAQKKKKKTSYEKLVILFSKAPLVTNRPKPVPDSPFQIPMCTKGKVL